MTKCNKISFKTEAEAVENLLASKLKYKYNTAQNVYICEECGFWHITSKGKVHAIVEKTLNDPKYKYKELASFYEEKYNKKRQ